MSKLDTLQGKALELASQLGDGIRHVPDQAGKWIKAGAAIGAARAGTKLATSTARRNPAVVAAAAVAAAGAGLLIYAVRRRKKAEGAANGATIEGKAKRVEARRAASTRPPRKKATTKRAARSRSAGSTGTDSDTGA